MEATDRLTTPEDTIIAGADTAGYDEIVDMISKALDLRLVTVASLVARSIELDRPDRDGPHRVIETLARCF